MAINNSVELRTEFVPLLDEKYRLDSRTAILDSSPDLVRLQAGEFKIPLLDLDGLGSHDRKNGGLYIDGNATLTWQTKTPTYDRNRMFLVDSQDDYETAGILFGRLSAVFIREKVTPEIDSWRIAKYFQNALAANIVEETIATPEALVVSVLNGITKHEENEVPQEDTYLFATPTIINQALLLKTTDSHQMFTWFDGRIVKTPQTRMNTKITLNDGVTAGQTAGGYAIAADSQQINFAIIHRGALIQGLKHEAPKYIPAAINQKADGHGFAYRVYGIEEVYQNKKVGLYFSIEPKE